MRKLVWIDNHIHVSDLNGDGSERPHFVDDLLAVLDAEEADLRLVVSPDGPRMSRICYESEGMTEGNTFIRDLVRAAPGRLYGSCMVNPRFLDESLRMMDLCLGEWGFVQLGEMLQYMMGYEMNSPPVEKLVRRAIEFGVPVQVHISTSNRQEHASSHGIAQLTDLSADWRSVCPKRSTFWRTRSGCDADPPVVDQYLDLIEQTCGDFPDNFWVEIRDFDSPGVRSVVERVPLTRLIAGTDWVTRVGPPFLPYGVVFVVGHPEENPYPPCVASMMNFLQLAGVDDAGIEMIAWRNLAGLLRIEP